MGSGAAIMAEPREYASYSPAKVDVRVLSRCRAAAELDGKTLQEWMSDVLNEAAAKVVKRDPVKRLPPPPHPKRPKR